MWLSSKLTQLITVVNQCTRVTTTLITYVSRSWRQSNPQDTRRRKHRCCRLCMCHHSGMGCYRMAVESVLQSDISCHQRQWPKHITTDNDTVTRLCIYYTSTASLNSVTSDRNTTKAHTETDYSLRKLVQKCTVTQHLIQQEYSLARNKFSQQTSTHGLHSCHQSIQEDKCTCNRSLYSRMYHRFRMDCYRTEVDSVLQCNFVTSQCGRQTRYQFYFFTWLTGTNNEDLYFLNLNFFMWHHFTYWSNSYNNAIFLTSLFLYTRTAVLWYNFARLTTLFTFISNFILLISTYEYHRYRQSIPEDKCTCNRSPYSRMFRHFRMDCYRTVVLVSVLQCKCIPSSASSVDINNIPQFYSTRTPVHLHSTTCALKFKRISKQPDVTDDMFSVCETSLITHIFEQDDASISIVCMKDISTYELRNCHQCSPVHTCNGNHSRLLRMFHRSRTGCSHMVVAASALQTRTQFRTWLYSQIYQTDEYGFHSSLLALSQLFILAKLSEYSHKYLDAF